MTRTLFFKPASSNPTEGDLQFFSFTRISFKTFHGFAWFLKSKTIYIQLAIRCLRQLLRGLWRPPMARFARHTLISLTFSKSLALVASLEKVKYSTWSRKTFKKVCLDSWSSICTDKFTASLVQSVLTIFFRLLHLSSFGFMVKRRRILFRKSFSSSAPHG